MSRRVLLVFGVMTIAGCGGVYAPNAGKPNPQAQSMQRMLADVKTLRGYVAGTAAQSDAETAAADLNTWSEQLGALFPPEMAAQYVDFTPEMARGGPAAMQATSAPLLAAVRSADRTTAGAALARAEKEGCGFCHRNGY